MGIDTTLDVADVPRFTDMQMHGWTGLLHPGFPTFGTITGLYSRWADQSSFGSMYKPAGWNDMWNAVMHEPNDTKRIELMKNIVRLDYNECVTFTWRSDAPFGVSDGTVHGFMLHAGGTMDFWWPDATWLSKK
jgi:hypothetical protein